MLSARFRIRPISSYLALPWHLVAFPSLAFGGILSSFPHYWWIERDIQRESLVMT